MSVPLYPWQELKAKLGTRKACNLSTQEVTAGGSKVQGQPQLCSKFEASLDYRRPGLQENKITLWLQR